MVKINKILVSFCFGLSVIYSTACAQKSTESFDTIPHKADFVVKINKELLTKDGIYLNEYVVNISPVEVAALNGKLVRISGYVTVLSLFANSLL